LLDSPKERAMLGANARAEAMRRFDLMNVCLPQQIQWVESLVVTNERARAVTLS